MREAPIPTVPRRPECRCDGSDDLCASCAHDSERARVDLADLHDTHVEERHGEGYAEGEGSPEVGCPFCAYQFPEWFSERESAHGLYMLRSQRLTPEDERALR